MTKEPDERLVRRAEEAAGQLALLVAEAGVAGADRRSAGLGVDDDLHRAGPIIGTGGEGREENAAGQRTE
jgi:hypothetical protein